MASNTYVEREAIEVLRVRADMKGDGPAAAMRTLESKLPSLKGRKFYGSFQLLPEGEEYYACVQRVPTDDVATMEVETGTIPGGLYARRRILDWQKIIADGGLSRIFDVMVLEYTIDLHRPYLEFYRSETELQFLFPVLSRDPRVD